MRVSLEHPLEKRLLDMFELNEAGLFRLSRFLLAHAALDRLLVLAVATKRLQKAGPIASNEIIAIVRELSKGTFACHLKRAIQEIPLSGDAERIARDITESRIIE